jgi:hypothetical protein
VEDFYTNIASLRFSVFLQKGSNRSPIKWYHSLGTAYTYIDSLSSGTASIGA